VIPSAVVVLLSIGDGAGDFQQAVVGAGREAELLDGGAQFEANRYYSISIRLRPAAIF
jgi:hypothetical protein